MKTWIFGLLASISILGADEFYSHINPLPYDAHGWFFNREQLDEVFAENRIKSVIELGSWAGRSTIYFGNKVGRGGKVFAIDTWRGTSDCTEQNTDPRLGYLFQLFLSNMKGAGVDDVVVPFRMSTDEAAAALNITADLIYVDGDHSTEQVFLDIQNWLPHLNEGGVMCGDDWEWPTVREAVERAARLYGFEIEASGNFWRYRS